METINHPASIGNNLFEPRPTTEERTFQEQFNKISISNRPTTSGAAYQRAVKLAYSLENSEYVSHESVPDKDVKSILTFIQQIGQNPHQPSLPQHTGCHVLQHRIYKARARFENRNVIPQVANIKCKVDRLEEEKVETKTKPQLSTPYDHCRARKRKSSHPEQSHQKK